MPRIVVGLSGGVDSAVAAGLLKQQGHEVLGVFMRNWEEPDGACNAEADFADARGVADRLGIDYYSIDFSREYRERVFAHFLAELNAGRTPNPDVLCNNHIKFEAFLNYAMQCGADALATGHYARIVHGPDGPRLHRAADENKDQTYFLHGLTREQLSRALFPLADHPKAQVRELARQWNLPVAEKKDSTGICFIGERNFRAFVKQYLPTQPGDMVTLSGEVVGRHEGLAFYTLGQRRGLGIGGRGAGGRWFVLQKRLEQNQLVVHQGDTPLLYAADCIVPEPHFINQAPAGVFAAQARLRHRQALQDCTVTLLPDGHARVVFAQPQRAVTPGQYCVWYQGTECLGGGVVG